MTETKPFLENAWYMAAWSHEVGEDMLRRRLLGEPILLMRRQDGTAVALVDRCPHRYAPLSKGEREGDTIVCPYHGLTFDAAGQCVRNPFSEKIPAARSCAAFPWSSATTSSGSGPAIPRLPKRRRCPIFPPS
ncbi:Rieske 2Fe-2S domain-containing protein [Novosphingobium sp. MBES04]|uniref:Rieske 2Fe-2S domain-containing protein n=1 Tax=Novosphingobium sp. MBES04 TaxID=1206458 RepID=UPI0006946641|nr:Rieske 2Fe-2S domain-containing protein [Novosphingobium sp. MBES04]GAM04555.1 hypothetical protein MBENS4_1553 [Novosphingobium sp. MBES04]